MSQLLVRKLGFAMNSNHISQGDTLQVHQGGYAVRLASAWGLQVHQGEYAVRLASDLVLQVHQGGYAVRLASAWGFTISKIWEDDGPNH